MSQARRAGSLVVQGPDLPDISVSDRIARMATKREHERKGKKQHEEDEVPEGEEPSVPNFGQRLLKLRDRFELAGSDREFSRFLGLNATTAISQLSVPLKATGRVPEPRLDKVAKIWSKLRQERIPVNADWFLTGRGSMSVTPMIVPGNHDIAPPEPVPSSLRRALESPRRSPFVEEVALLFARRTRAEMTTKKWSEFLDGLATVEHNGLLAAGLVATNSAPVDSASEDEARWMFAIGAQPAAARKAAPKHEGTKAAPPRFEESADFPRRKRAEHEDD